MSETIKAGTVVHVHGDNCSPYTLTDKGWRDKHPLGNGNCYEVASPWATVLYALATETAKREQAERDADALRDKVAELEDEIVDMLNTMEDSEG